MKLEQRKKRVEYMGFYDGAGVVHKENDQTAGDVIPRTSSA